MDKLYNDKLAIFNTYSVSLINGWSGWITVFAHKQITFVAITGILYPSNATDDVFAYSGGLDDCLINHGLPVSSQGARIFVNQDLMHIKITFVIVGSQWYATIDRTQIPNGAAIDNVYARS